VKADEGNDELQKYDDLNWGLQTSAEVSPPVHPKRTPLCPKKVVAVKAIDY
jgi:hypothetical protein